VRFRLARGADAPSSETPPRSGARCPLERGPVSIESRTPPQASFRLARGHHGAAASIPAPPAGAFNALTFVGAQVKGESTPLRAWESCPGTASPTTVARPSPPLCDAVRHGQQQPRGTVPPIPVQPARRTLEEGQRSPRREDEQLRHAHARTTPWRRADGTGHLHRHWPCATIPAVPNAIPATVSPSLTLWKRAATGRRHANYCTPVRPRVNGTLEPSHGRSPNKRPLHRHPRSRSWTRTGRALRPTRSQIRQDGRLLRDVVHHTSTRRRNIAASL
jgi:hypothetical protein